MPTRLDILKTVICNDMAQNIDQYAAEHKLLDNSISKQNKGFIHFWLSDVSMSMIVLWLIWMIVMTTILVFAIWSLVRYTQ